MMVVAMVVVVMVVVVMVVMLVLKEMIGYKTVFKGRPLTL